MAKKLIVATSSSALGAKRLTKVAAKYESKAREERREFVGRVLDTKKTVASSERAATLIERVRDAKKAPFLGQYRRVR